MSVQNFFSFLNGFYPPNSLKKTQDTQEPEKIISNNHSNRQVDISHETLSKAVLCKQSDGRLQFWFIGTQNWLTFRDEKQLDNYLRGNENVDIWEIEDKREQKPKIIYKYHNGWDEEETFTCIDKLYREISSGTEHGVFCIHDINTDQKKFVQQKQGWFQYGFEEVSFEKATKSFISREATKARLKKCYAVGLGALAVSQAVIGIGKTFSITLQNMTTSNNVLSPSNFYLSPPSFHKIIAIFSAALMTYEKNPQGQFLPRFLPAVLFGLSGFEYVKAQLFCPKIEGNFNYLGNIATSMVISGNYLYVAADSCCPSPNPNFWIIDVRNISSPTIVGSFYHASGSRSLAVSGNYAYIYEVSGNILILNISNPCFSSSSTSSSSSSISTSSSSSSIRTSSRSSSILISSLISSASTIISTSSTSRKVTSVASKSFSETFLPSREPTLQTVGDITSGGTSNPLGIGMALGIGIASGLFVGIISGGTALLLILKKQQNRTSQPLEERGFKENRFLEEDSRANTSESPYGFSSRVTQETSGGEYQRTPDEVHPLGIEE